MTGISTKKTVKNDDSNNEIEAVVNVPKKNISPEEREKIIDELRLVSKKDVYF